MTEGVTKWSKVAHTAQQSKYKLRRKRKKAAKIALLKEISRRLALGLELPPEALAYAKGKSLDPPQLPAAKEGSKRRSKKLDFYSSSEWRKVRYEAIKRANGRCEACGRSPKDGVVLHADHIKPRSKYPHLALNVNNVQLLCEDCNLGKSNRDETDWRPHEVAMLPEEREWEREAWERFDTF